METRKNAQTGVAHIWHLWANDTDPRICPKRALIRLARIYGRDYPKTGPLFLQMNNYGVVMGKAIVCYPYWLLREVPVAHPPGPCPLFLGHQTTPMMTHHLATDLQSLGYKSWSMYGTHSFCCGGCQHQLHEQNWTPAMLASWGGWSQVEATTMFHYFYSPNDNDERMIDYDHNDSKMLCF